MPEDFAGEADEQGPMVELHLQSFEEEVHKG